MFFAGLAFLSVGVFAFAFAAYCFATHRTLCARGVRRLGRATVATDTDGGASLIVSFTDETGAPYTATSQGSNSAWASRRGDELAVLYLPGRPEQARIEMDLVFQKRLCLWLGPAFLALGAVLAVVGSP